MKTLDKLKAKMEGARDAYATARATDADATARTRYLSARACYHNACVSYYAVLAAQTKDPTDD